MLATSSFSELLWGPHDCEGLFFEGAVIKDGKCIPKHFKDPGELESALKRCEGHDAYIGASCGPRPEAGRRFRRDRLVYSAAVVVDIDHEKNSGRQRQAVELANSLGVLPSVIIATGGGVHAWFLFAELESADTTTRIGRGLVEAYRHKAEQMHLNWNLDAAFGAERLWRWPGGKNYKYDPPRDVTIVGLSDVRTTIEDLSVITNADVWSRAIRKLGPDEVPDEVSAAVEGADGSLPAIVRMGIQNHEEMRAIWDQTSKKKCFAEGKQSSWDLAWVNKVRDLGIEGDELARCLVIYRERWDSSGKARRPDYIWRTIQVAENATSTRQAFRIQAKVEDPNLKRGRPARGEEREKTPEEFEPKEPGGDDVVVDMSREEALVALNDSLQLESNPLVEIERYGRTNTEFRLCFQDGVKVRLRSEEITKHGAFSLALMNAVSVPVLIEAKAWKAVWPLFWYASELQECSDATDAVRYMLLEYLEASDVSLSGEDTDMWQDAANSGQPFVKDGMVHVSFMDLKQRHRVEMTDFRHANQDLGGRCARVEATPGEAQKRLYLFPIKYLTD